MKIQWGLRSILGLVLILLALVSLLLNIAGIAQVWVLREPLTRDAINTLDLLNSTLDTTSQGLGVAKTSLRSVTVTIGALQTTVASAATTIDNTSTAVSSLSTVIGTNLTGTLNSAIGALDAVETTTQTIDSVLGALAAIPFLGVQYDPAKSLSSSVSDVTDQLKQVPQSFGELEKNLGTSGSSLDKVGDDAKTLSSSLGSVQSDLSQLVGVLEQYETQVKAFQGTVRNLRENIVTIGWALVGFSTFLLFWLGVTMFQTLLTGLRWMGVNVDGWLPAPNES